MVPRRPLPVATFGNNSSHLARNKILILYEGYKPFTLVRLLLTDCSDIGNRQRNGFHPPDIANPELNQCTILAIMNRLERIVRP